MSRVPAKALLQPLEPPKKQKKSRPSLADTDDGRLFPVLLLHIEQYCTLLVEECCLCCHGGIAQA